MTEGSGLRYRAEADYAIATRYYLHQVADGLVTGAGKRLAQGFDEDKGGRGGAEWDEARRAVDSLLKALGDAADMLEQMLARPAPTKQAQLKAARTRAEEAAQAAAFRCWQAAGQAKAALAEAFPDAEERKAGLRATLDALAAFEDEARLLAPASDFAEYSSSTRQQRLDGWDFRACGSYSELAKMLAVPHVPAKRYAKDAVDGYVAPRLRRMAEAGELSGMTAQEAVELVAADAVEEAAYAMADDITAQVKERLADNEARRELCNRVVPRVARATCSKPRFRGALAELAEAAAEALL